MNKREHQAKNYRKRFPSRGKQQVQRPLGKKKLSVSRIWKASRGMERSKHRLSNRKQGQRCPQRSDAWCLLGHGKDFVYLIMTGRYWGKSFEPWHLIYIFKIQPWFLSRDSMLGRWACRQDISKKVITVGQTRDDSGMKRLRSSYMNEICEGNGQIMLDSGIFGPEEKAIWFCHLLRWETWNSWLTWSDKYNSYSNSVGIFSHNKTGIYLG